MSLGVFSLLRKQEIMAIKRENVTIKENGVYIKYLYPTKHCMQGFNFKIPECLVDAFRTYNAQLLAIDKNSDLRYLQKYNMKVKNRTTNKGDSVLYNALKVMYKKLGKNRKEYTVHCCRRTGATIIYRNDCNTFKLKVVG